MPAEFARRRFSAARKILQSSGLLPPHGKLRTEPVDAYGQNTAVHLKMLFGNTRAGMRLLGRRRKRKPN